jgi:uncharacterized membrane protein
VGAHYESTPTSGRGFLRDTRGVFTIFDARGAAGATAATGINNRGEIVGQYVDAKGARHGFLRNRDGEITTVDVPRNNGFSVAIHLNDRTDVVGGYLRPGASDPSRPAPTAPEIVMIQ